MRIINSPVRSSSLDRLVSYRSKAGIVAAAKKIVHKQERARLRQFACHDLIQHHLVSLAEQTEQDRLDQETFQNLMRKVMSKGRPAHQQTSNARPVDRCEFRIERRSSTGDRHFAVLASCAIDV